MNKAFVHFLFEFSDLPLNLNTHGIKIDDISSNEPPRLLINIISFFFGIKFFKTLYNINVRANNIVKNSFFPIIPKIVGNFDIFI